MVVTLVRFQPKGDSQAFCGRITPSDPLQTLTNCKWFFIDLT